MITGFALSGLQDFLYDLGSANLSREDRSEHGGRERDAARRLRIRSALLTLVPGLVAWEVRRHDPNSEILYLGGGKLLVSHGGGVPGQLQPLLEELYDWLVRSSAGKAGTYWATIPAESVDGPALAELLGRLATAKWQAGRWGRWHGSAGVISRREASGTLGDRGWESDSGATFARREDWKGFKVGSDGWNVGPWRLGPVTEAPDIAIAGRAKAAVNVSIPTYTPKRNGETVPLFELAELDHSGAPRSGGAYLAMLKLDGDGVGALMSQALGTGLDRYRETSRNLADFFGPGMLDSLRQNFPRLYLVYSGGDDLVATGWFDDVLRAALHIRSQYQKLGLGSVSAGVAFYGRQSPLLKAIEAADEELARAKETRDAVSVAGCRFAWDDFGRALRHVGALVQAIEEGSINRGALQMLRQLGEPWLESAPEPLAATQFRSIPLAHYMVDRRQGWKRDRWPAGLDEMFHSLTKDEKHWPQAALVGTLAAWRTKRQLEEA